MVRSTELHNTYMRANVHVCVHSCLYVLTSCYLNQHSARTQVPTPDNKNRSFKNQGWPVRRSMNICEWHEIRLETTSVFRSTRVVEQLIPQTNELQ